MHTQLFARYLRLLNMNKKLYYYLIFVQLFKNIQTNSSSIVKHGECLSVSFIFNVFKFVCLAELNDDANISKIK